MGTRCDKAALRRKQEGGKRHIPSVHVDYRNKVTMHVTWREVGLVQEVGLGPLYTKGVSERVGKAFQRHLWTFVYLFVIDLSTIHLKNAATSVVVPSSEAKEKAKLDFGGKVKWHFYWCSLI